MHVLVLKLREFLNRFLTNTQIFDFTKIHPLGAEPFYVERRTDRQTDLTKLTVAFHSCVTAPNNESHAYTK